MDPLPVGTLLVAPPSEDADPLFHRTIILVVDREPNGITSGLALNRPLEQRAIERSALAPLFLPDPQAPAYWGGPMGEEPAVLAEFTSSDSLEWFHLGVRQHRPFPVPNVGLVALGEHADAFEGRIRRARLFVGMCVWGEGQLEAEVARGEWECSHATAEDIFTRAPGMLWDAVRARAQ